MKCVYLRTNIINGMAYVGLANDFERREYDWNYLKKPYAGAYIDRARKKYGVENFKTEILVECETQEELSKWEQYYIKELNTKFPNGYNLTDGGEYGIKGFKHTEESKNKMSEAKKGSTPWMKGKHHTEDSKKKQSEARKGKPSKKRKKVYQYTLDGELVKVWDSTYIDGFNEGHIAECCRGERKTAYGYIWKYSEGNYKAQKPNNKKRKVYQYTLNNELVKEWESNAECGRNGYSSGNISSCCNGKLQQYKGYKWSYEPL